MQADVLTLPAYALTMPAYALTMPSDTLTMLAYALTLQGIAKFNFLEIYEMMYLAFIAVLLLLD
ncbi:hypothetical protein [Nostoc sp.]|uniref:hypothetical protein n=1 Tax=Nostoc sp. TaxID=1180 RepID=UPI002FFA11E8